MNDKQQTGSNRNGGRVTDHLVADAASFMRVKRFFAQGPFQVLRQYRGDIDLPWEERYEIASLAMTLGLIPADKDFLYPVVQPNVNSDQTRVAQQSNIRERLIETSTQRGDDDDLSWTEFQ